MPMHDWKKVPDGIYHACHHGWVQTISDDLNSRRLPRDYYALPEQVAGGLGPEACIMVPLETSYAAAYQAMPGRWREVLETSR